MVGDQIAPVAPRLEMEIADDLSGVEVICDEPVAVTPAEGAEHLAHRPARQAAFDHEGAPRDLTRLDRLGKREPPAVTGQFGNQVVAAQNGPAGIGLEASHDTNHAVGVDCPHPGLTPEAEKAIGVRAHLGQDLGDPALAEGFVLHSARLARTERPIGHRVSPCDGPGPVGGRRRVAGR